MATIAELPLAACPTPEELRVYFEQRVLEPTVCAFLGPPQACIGDVPYFVLSSYGIKEEGASVFPSDLTSPARTIEEAINRFEDQLRALIQDRKPGQLAWRRLPEARLLTKEEQEKERLIIGESSYPVDGDRAYVTARIALLRCVA
jgi:hypothetical protein